MGVFFISYLRVLLLFHLLFNFLNKNLTVWFYFIKRVEGKQTIIKNEI